MISSSILLTLALAVGPLDTAWWSDEAPSAPGTTNLLTSLAAHYKFEDAAGANRVDSHTGGFDLIRFVSDVTRSDNSKVGDYSTQFDGVSGSYLSNAPAAFLWGDSSCFSVNFWVSAELTSTNNFIVGLWDVATAGSQLWRVLMRNDRKIMLQIDGVVGQLTATNNTTSISDSGWFMVTVTYGSESAKIYVNNSVETVAVNLDGFDNTDAQMFVVGDYTDPDYISSSFKIDSLSYWTNRVLSANEVTTLYNGSIGLDYPLIP